MAHYFTNDNVKSDEKLIKVKIKNQDYSFYVDNGVFSKRGLDFGTRTLLENLDLENIKGKILDFGCGYGPIGIFLSKNLNVTVDMIDINKRSLNLAKKNSVLNNAKTNIFESDIYQNITEKYDFIITNPPIRVGKKVLYEILFGAYDYLNDNGQMIIVVNKDQGAKSLIRDLEDKYKVSVINKSKGFYVISMAK